MRCAVLAAIVASFALDAGSIAVAQDRAGGLAALNRLVGTWSGSGTFVDSAYSKAGSANATTTCAWSADGQFLICQQSAMANGKTDDDVAIYTYDAAAAKYHFYNVGVSRANGTELAVDPKTITYADSFRDGAKQVTTRTLNVWVTPQHYTWRAEYSLDGGASWTLMGSGSSSRNP